MPIPRLRDLLEELQQIATARGVDHTRLTKVASTGFDTVSQLDRDIDEYRRLGVDHLQVVLPAQDAAATLAQITDSAALQQ